MFASLIQRTLNGALAESLPASPTSSATSPADSTVSAIRRALSDEATVRADDRAAGLPRPHATADTINIETTTVEMTALTPPRIPHMTLTTEKPAVRSLRAPKQRTFGLSPERSFQGPRRD